MLTRCVIATNLNPESGWQVLLWLDLEAFEACTAQADPASLQTAITLYRGDIMDGFYDNRIVSERYQLEALFLEVLARLMILYEAAGNYQAALATDFCLLQRNQWRGGGGQDEAGRRVRSPFMLAKQPHPVGSLLRIRVRHSLPANR